MTTTPAHSDLDLLDRYFAETASMAEVERVRMRLASDATFAALHDALRAELFPPALDLARDDARAWTRIRDAMTDHGQRAATVQPSSTIRRTIMAASIGASLAVIGAIVWHHNSTNSSVIASETRYATTAGQRATVRFPDGAVITLAPATTIGVAHGAVTIQGEAYFDIPPRADRPFTVHTTNAIVRVLGTKFTVRQYADDANSRVVVEDGKVALRARGQPMATAAQAILSTRMLGEISADSGVTVTSDVILRDYLGWTNGHLVFRQAPMRAVAAELARAYGVEIEIADTALARRNVTMDASTRTDAVYDVLRFVARTLDAHVVRVGPRFVIQPGREAEQAPPRTRPSQGDLGYGR